MNARDEMITAYPGSEEWPEIALMYHVANDGECYMLDRLQRKAGITWEHYGCWTNGAENASCENCGTPWAEILEEDRDGEPRASALAKEEERRGRHS